MNNEQSVTFDEEKYEWYLRGMITGAINDQVLITNKLVRMIIL